MLDKIIVARGGNYMNTEMCAVVIGNLGVKVEQGSGGIENTTDKPPLVSENMKDKPNLNIDRSNIKGTKSTD